MNSSDLLKRYANGERDFSNADLHGIDLREAMLRGANGPCWPIYTACCRRRSPSRWSGTRNSKPPVNLWAYWQVGEKEPWLLATNLPTAAETQRTYGYLIKWREDSVNGYILHALIRGL